MTKIFVSASTNELGSFRKAARDALASIGVTPIVQERFPTDYREIEQILKERISECDAVICLVGFGYGYEPLRRPSDKPRRSYTQIEYDIAMELKKNIYIFLSDENLSPDNPINEDDEKCRLQLEHRVSFPKDQIKNNFSIHTDIYRLIANLPFRPRLPIKRSMRLLPSGAEELFGRGEELEFLDAVWYDPNVHIASITAWGGAGKTSLIARWLEKMNANDYYGAEQIFVWPFFGQGSSENSDLFFVNALEFFEDKEDADPIISPFEKGERLAELITSRCSLLVLDGIESLVESSGPPSGQLKDPAIKTLLECLASSTNGLCRLCIITSRVNLRDLDRWKNSSVRQLALKELDELAGAELLRNTGVIGSEDELHTASSEVNGHPLTLELMGRYLTAAHGGDIHKRDRIQLEKADTQMQGGHAFQIMKTYEEWLVNGGEAGRRQLALLHLVGFFDRSADAGCLDALQKAPVIEGLTEDLPDSDSDDWNLAIFNLQKLGLVRKVIWEPGPISGYSEQQAAEARSHRDPGKPQVFPRPYYGEHYALEAHPLIREYFARWLKEHRPQIWRVGNERLYKYLIQSVPYWPEGFEGLQPLYQAVVHGCAAGRHVEACMNIYLNRIQRKGYGDGYSTSVIGSVSADLATVTCFFDQPWSRVHASFPEPGIIWVLRDAAFNLECLGRLEEALEPMRKAAESTNSIAIKENADLLWLQASSRYNDLSRLELSLGRIAEAIQSAEQSCALAENAGTINFESVKGHATWGDALTQAGENIKALNHFRQAEQLQHKGLPQPVLFSLQGYQYCELLLSKAERAAWRIYMAVPDIQSSPPELSSLLQSLNDVEQRAEVIIQTAEQDTMPLDQAFGHLALGKVALYRAIVERSPYANPQAAMEQALKHVNTAHEFARRIGYMDALIRILNFRAWVHSLLGDLREAENDLNKARDNADRCSMRLRAADERLVRARLFRDKDVLSEARKRIEQIGFFHRKQELEHAEEDSRCW